MLTCMQTHRILSMCLFFTHSYTNMYLEMFRLWSVLTHYLASLLSHACMHKQTEMHAWYICTQTHKHTLPALSPCSHCFNNAQLQPMNIPVSIFFSPSLSIISNFSSKPLREPAAKYGQACVMNFVQPSKLARRSWPLRPCLRLSFRHHFAGPWKEVRCACARVRSVNPRQSSWPVSF